MKIEGVNRIGEKGREGKGQEEEEEEEEGGIVKVRGKKQVDMGRGGGLFGTENSKNKNGKAKQSKNTQEKKMKILSTNSSSSHVLISSVSSMNESSPL